MEWISVKDRLPEENKLVLTFIKRVDYPSYYKLNFRQEGMWREDLNFLDTITHWTPLPKAPKQQ